MPRTTRAPFKRSRTTDAFESDLRAAISEGRLRPGDLILSISQICARYRLKPGSVQKALRRLEGEGYVETRHGSGTFVSAGFLRGPVRVHVGRTSPLLDFYEETARRSAVGPVLVDDRREADVIFGSGIGIHQASAAGRLAPVDSRISDDPRLSRGGWCPRTLERYRLGGRTYALPVYASPVVLFYNRDLFGRAGLAPPQGGWKWRDLAAAVRKLRKYCDVRTAGVLPFTNQFTFYVPFLAQNGARVFSSSGECRLTERRALEAVGVVRGLRRDAGGTVCSDRREIITRFFSGGSAMVIWSSQLMSPLTKDPPFRWGWAPLPAQRRRATLFLSEGVSVVSSSQRQSAAWEFVRECVSEQAQRYFVERRFPFPGRGSAVEEYAARHGTECRRLLKQIDNAVTEHYRFPHVFQVLNREMDGFLDPDRPPAAVRGQCEIAARVVESLIQTQEAAPEQLMA